MSKSKDFSIIKASGRQFKVSVGDVVRFEKMEGKEGDKVVFDEVLLTSKKGKSKVGKPTVKGAEVEGKIMEHGRDKKVEILKFKAKSRYRRTMGHKQPHTKVKIIKI